MGFGSVLVIRIHMHVHRRIRGLFWLYVTFFIKSHGVCEHNNEHDRTYLFGYAMKILTMGAYVCYMFSPRLNHFT